MSIPGRRAVLPAGPDTGTMWGLLTLQLERVPRNPSFGPEPEPKGRTPPPRRKTPSLAEPTPAGWRQPCAPVETGISGASVKCRWSWASKVVQRRTNTPASFPHSVLSSSCPLSDWIKLCLHSSFSSKEKFCPRPWVPLFSFTHRFSS